MKISLIMLILLCLCSKASTQPSGGVEQYYYLGDKSAFTWVPIAYYQSNKNWYGEARYNYEGLNTFSLYAGKTFSRNGNFFYSATPVVGAVLGRMVGGSTGVNIYADYKGIIFSSQSQYTFSFKGRTNNFIYSWSELSYRALGWVYAGLALQQTNLYQTACSLENGMFIGFTYKQWTFPMYMFEPASNNRHFVLGISWEWQQVRRGSKIPASLPLIQAGGASN